MTLFTEHTAKLLAKIDPDYVAKRMRNGQWAVWSMVSNHLVEFDNPEKIIEYVLDR